MSFQLKKLIFYNHIGECKTLDFKTNSLNIITGSSKTGKSALIPILEYCLGREKCKIPSGILRKSLSWVGVILTNQDGEILIVRRVPDLGAQSSTDIYLVTGKNLAVPNFDELRQNFSTSDLISYLSEYVGIKGNISHISENSTRDKLTANIKHGLFFIFQEQGELISKTMLFHRQGEVSIAQTIKDVLPYFLDIKRDDFLAQINHLRELKRQLRQVNQTIEEYKSILGTGVSRAKLLLSEAYSLGLYENNTVPDSFDLCIKELQEIAKNGLNPIKEEYLEESTLIKVRQERESLRDRYQQLKEHLAASESLIEDRNTHVHELQEQNSRLSAINLFEKEFNENLCPLCECRLPEDKLPNFNELIEEHENYSKQVVVFSKPPTKLINLSNSFQEELDTIKEKLEENAKEMEILQNLNEKIREIRDQNTKQAYLMGKIDLYLESPPKIKPHNHLENEALELKQSIEKIEAQIEKSTNKDSLESIISIISSDISQWAKELKLEHSNYPLRFDIKNLTIIADTEYGPIPMEQMGSGENWVGYHLITHCALHKWFSNHQRPIPRFLLFDQPSQIYFPADTSYNSDNIDEDREAVRRMFYFLYNFVKQLNNKIQIIVTDHADIDEQWFQESVIARWRNNVHLVPAEWDGIVPSTDQENQS